MMLTFIKNLQPNSSEIAIYANNPSFVFGEPVSTCMAYPIRKLTNEGWIGVYKKTLQTSNMAKAFLDNPRVMRYNKTYSKGKRKGAS